MEETITTPFLGRAWRLHSYGIAKASVAWMQTGRLDAALKKHLVRNALPGPQKMCSASHKSRQIQQDDRHGQFGLGSDGLKSNEFKFRV